MKKWLMIGGAVVLVGLVALLFMARTMLTKDYLVRMIEESIDSRVQIGELKVSLFSFPARIELKDVVIAERDRYADEGVAHDERPELAGGAIAVESVVCDLTLGDLLARRIRVERFDLSGLDARAVIYEDGSNSLDALFAEPEKTREKKERERREKGFNAKDHKEFVAELERVVIDHCRFELEVEKTGVILVGERVGIDVEDIRIDPNALERVNEARLSLRGRLVVFSNERERVKFGAVGFEGPARARLFDSVSGDFEPDVDLDLKISEDSYVSSEVPYVEKVAKVTRKLDDLGLAKIGLPEQMGFGRGRELKASYRKGRMELRGAVAIEMEGWELGVGEGSWFQTGDETHRFRGELVASEKVGRWVRKNLERVVKVAPRELRRGLEKELIGSLWMDGRLTLRLSTKGELSDPKIDLKQSVPDMKDAAKDFAKKKLFDFAKGFLEEDE